jgi:hypothetical protein
VQAKGEIAFAEGLVEREIEMISTHSEMFEARLIA